MVSEPVEVRRLAERCALPKAEQDVLFAMSQTAPDFAVLNFATIAEWADIDRKKVCRPVRSLARKGMAEFFRVSWDDDGVPKGAGYAITQAGRDWVAASLRALAQPTVPQS